MRLIYKAIEQGAMGVEYEIGAPNRGTVRLRLEASVDSLTEQLNGSRVRGASGLNGKPIHRWVGSV